MQESYNFSCNPSTKVQTSTRGYCKEGFKTMKCDYHGQLLTTSIYIVCLQRCTSFFLVTTLRTVIMKVSTFFLILQSILDKEDVENSSSKTMQIVKMCKGTYSKGAV